MKKSETSVLQDDEDFLVERLVWQGQPVVKKSTKPTTPPERAARLQNEAYGMRFLADLAARQPQLQLYVPKLYKISPESMLREYIDGEPVAHGQPLKQAKNNLDKLAGLLTGIDRLEPYGETRFVGHFDYRDVRKNFDKWTAKPLEERLISPSQVQAISRIIDQAGQLQPRLAHGDLSPQAHAFLQPDGKVAWIDLENFTPSGARYYDVARVYVRLYSFEPSTETAKYFLESFLSHADKFSGREAQLMAIMAQRTLGMQYDAWYDAKKGDDYRPRAKELLELVVQNKLGLLHS